MRILRRRSNLEVSSKGFALFVASLVLATFLGGAVRTILSSDRVHQRIARELKSRFPRNEIELGRIEVRLSDGLMPGLGLRVRDLVVRQHLCGKLSFDLTVPEAHLPVRIMSLRGGRPRLGRLQIPRGHVDLDYKACPRPGAPAEPPSLRETVQERGIRPPRLDWSDVAETIDGVDLGEFELNFKRTPEWKLRVATARVRFGRELDVNATLDVQRALPFGTLSHLVNVEATGRQGEIAWLVTSELKEGRLRWSGTWNLAENAAESKFRAVQVPLKEVAIELYQMGLIARELKFKSAWFSGEAQWAGQLARPLDAPIIWTTGRIEGGYGRAQLERAEYYPGRATAFAPPAEVHLHRLNVQSLAEALGVKLWPAVISRPGAWSGRAFVSSGAEWTALGRLEGLEVSFSNQSVRGKQLVNGVDLAIRHQNDQTSVVADKIVLNDGAADGRLDFRYSADRRDGAVEVRMNKFSFSPAIQHVLVGGRLGPVALGGTAVIHADELSSWTGVVRAATIGGEGWRIEGAEARTDFQAGTFNVAARANRAVVEPTWRYYEQVHGALARDPAQYAWRDLVARVGVRVNGGTISDFTARDAGGHGEWRGQGTWRRDGELNASVRDAATAGSKSFRIFGEKGTLAVTPQ